MNKIYYFAYGSNLLFKRFLDRLQFLLPNKGKNAKYKPYRLYGYKLVFNCGQQNREKFANIIPSEHTDFVEGILYESDSECMNRLDYIEGLYRKEFFLTENNEICYVYVGEQMFCRKEELPSLDYLNMILDGAFESGLFYTYNRLVDFKLANYNLPNGSRHKKIIKI